MKNSRPHCKHVGRFEPRESASRTDAVSPSRLQEGVRQPVVEHEAGNSASSARGRPCTQIPWRRPRPSWKTPTVAVPDAVAVGYDSRMFISRILVLGSLCLGLIGCGGVGDSTKPNSMVTVNYSSGPGQTGTISFTGNTWQATRSATTITATTPLENGDRVTVTTPNPAGVPATYQWNEVTVSVMVDGVTYTPAPGFTLTVTNASGNFAGTFTGPASSAGSDIEITSGSFLIQY